MVLYLVSKSEAFAEPLPDVPSQIAGLHGLGVAAQKTESNLLVSAGTNSSAASRCCSSWIKIRQLRCDPF
jgi:hypothetical protein